MLNLTWELRDGCHIAEWRDGSNDWAILSVQPRMRGTKNQPERAWQWMMQGNAAGVSFEAGSPRVDAETTIEQAQERAETFLACLFPHSNE